MIAAILRAQFLSMRLRPGAALGIVAGAIWYGVWCVVALAAGMVMASADAQELGRLLPLGLAVVFVYWQFMPIVSASLGASLDMRKLRVYPVPHGQLFLVEVLLRLTTAIEMLILLCGGAIGLVRNSEAGGVGALPRVLLAVLLFVVFNLLLASGLRSILERLMARRLVREVFAIVMAMVWVLPRFLMPNGGSPKWLRDAGPWVQMFALPWTAAADAVLGRSATLSVLCLLIWIALALWFGRTQFERNLRYDSIAAQATRVPPQQSPAAVHWTERIYRWPSLIWRDPLAAIVEKELRSLARTPRFRMVFVMGFTFGLLVWFPVIAGRREGNAADSPYFLIVVCVYALILLGQVSYWNSFGFDRSAAALYFAAPQPLSRVLAGKNIAALVFIYLEVLIVAGVVWAVGVAGGWPRIVEAIIVVGVCALYLLALGNISSVRYPRAVNPERVSQGGGSGKHGLLFLLYPLSLSPVFLAYLARFAFDSNLAFAFVLALAAIGGGAVYAMAMESAVSNAVRRREELLNELGKGEGPVSAG